MGMVCTLRRVGASAIDEVRASPAAALALLDDHADAYFPVEKVQMPGCLGFLLRLTPIEVTQVAERPKGEALPAPEKDPDRLGIEVWDVINFLLTGTATGGQLPASFLVTGGEDLDVDDDETHVYLLTPQEVAEIDRYLQSLTLDDLRARIDVPRMVKARLLSGVKGPDAEEKVRENLEHVLVDFTELRAFVAGTREKGDGLLVMIN
jgi:hypothetical protein